MGLVPLVGIVGQEQERKLFSSLHKATYGVVASGRGQKLTRPKHLNPIRYGYIHRQPMFGARAGRLNSLIIVSIREQRLQLRADDAVSMDVSASTAANGPGEQAGSECTPRGWHRVRARIGAGAASGAVFVGRRASGELYTPALRVRYPERDWILTRILWLCGLEPGRNRLGAVDTQRRYIYIHGGPDEEPMGIPGSHGCVRIGNTDMIRLFERVPIGTRVWITEGPLPDDIPIWSGR